MENTRLDEDEDFKKIVEAAQEKITQLQKEAVEAAKASKQEEMGMDVGSVSTFDTKKTDWDKSSEFWLKKLGINKTHLLTLKIL